MEEMGLQFKPEIPLETVYEEVQKNVDIDNWVQKRGPRPWEENFNVAKEWEWRCCTHMRLSNLDDRFVIIAYFIWNIYRWSYDAKKKKIVYQFNGIHENRKMKAHNQMALFCIYVIEIYFLSSYINVIIIIFQSTYFLFLKCYAKLLIIRSVLYTIK